MMTEAKQEKMTAVTADTHVGTHQLSAFAKDEHQGTADQ